MPSWFEELAEFLRIPSISADPQCALEVRRAGEWVCEFIREAGGESELLDWHGQPLALGELCASVDPENAPTVLCYGHFDVQPPDPLELWESLPSSHRSAGSISTPAGSPMTRGSSTCCSAPPASWPRRGSCRSTSVSPATARRRRGGHSIVEFLEADERGADVAVIFDSLMVGRGVPAFNIATRGLLYFHISLRTGERDLHSGLFGGSALNAAHALIRTLDALIARDGRLLEPLRKGVLPPAPEELAGWRELPAGVDELAAQGAQPMDAHAAEEHYLRTFAEPALDVNGIESGSPHSVKTVLPVEANANVSIRLAAGQDPAEIAAAFEQILREAAPPGSTLEIDLLSSAPPGIVPPDTKAVRLGLTAFERALGVRPLLIRSGGALPLVPALASKGIPTIISGFALPDANIHSPDERMLVEYIPTGIAAARALFEEFASLRS